PGWDAHGGDGDAGRVDPRPCGVTLRNQSGRRRTVHVLGLWRTRPRGTPALSPFIDGRRGTVYGAGRSARFGTIETRRLQSRGTVQHRCVRRRILRPIVAGALALSSVPSVGRDGLVDPVLEQRVFRPVLSGRRADFGADRPDQYDGVHTPAIEHLSDPGPVCAEPRHGDWLAAGPQRAIADGCAHANLVRYGGGDARGAARRGEHHSRAPEPRHGGEPDPRGV